MKIQKMINIAEKQINKQKIINKNNLINKYVKIHDVNTYGDSFNQMYNAKEVMGSQLIYTMQRNYLMMTNMYHRLLKTIFQIN